MTTRVAEGPSGAALIAAFAAIYLCWGATFLAIRYAVAELPPLLTIALRCAGGGLVLLAWLGARGALVPVPRPLWPRIAGAGVLLFLGCHGLLAWAEQRVSSGEAALYMAAIPLWLVSLDALVTRRRPSGGVIAGLVLGVAGVTVLVGGQTVAGSSAAPLDRIGLLVSAFCWAVGSLVGRDRRGTVPAGQVTALQLLAGSVVVLAASAAAGELAAWSPSALSGRAAGAMVFLVLGGTVLGFGAYSWLLRVASPAAVGTYAFVNPVVALGLAVVAGDGTVGARGLLAAALVVAGVAAIWAGSGRVPPRAGAAAPSLHPAEPRLPPTGAADGSLRRAGSRVPPAASEAAG
ncbi:MAG TPA: EamA family transporter [Gemmatimonadales bacterium]|nr:EamA family transporter [Gemmatimonadales bacterium]